jgi:hypothetical protein
MTLINNILLKTNFIKDLANVKEDNFRLHHLNWLTLLGSTVLLAVVLFCAFLLKARYVKWLARRELRRRDARLTRRINAWMEDESEAGGGF